MEDAHVGRSLQYSVPVEPKQRAEHICRGRRQSARGRTFTAFSAGIEPAKHIDPLALDILNLALYPTVGLCPKILGGLRQSRCSCAQSWEDFAKAGAPALNFVFTLCNPVVGEPSHTGQDGPSRPIGATPILKICRASNESGASNDGNSGQPRATV
jgi:hypothetical protein